MNVTRRHARPDGSTVESFIERNGALTMKIKIASKQTIVVAGRAGACCGACCAPIGV